MVVVVAVVAIFTVVAIDLTRFFGRDRTSS